MTLSALFIVMRMWATGLVGLLMSFFFWLSGAQGSLSEGGEIWSILAIKSDWMSWWLSGLTLITIYLMVLTSFSSPGIQNKGFYFFLMYLLGLVVCVFFWSNNYLSLYIFFELSLLPIMIMILGWGYQMERVSAGLAMLLYTIFGAIPLLAGLLMVVFSTFGLSLEQLMGGWGGISASLGEAFFILMVLAFLVKVPMFPLHLWLPKAHVEAPVAGSMILAGVLLKMGGYGIIQVLWVVSDFSSSVLVQSWALSGGVLMSVLCLRQMDMKVLIAYSSVCHMSLAIMLIFMNVKSSLGAAMLVLMSHGVASSGMFAGANIYYMVSSSRNMGVMSGVLQVMPIVSLMWFLMCMGNMGTPPTLNFLSELSGILVSLKDSSMLILELSLLTFLAVAFSLSLYSSTSHGKSSNSSAIVGESSVLVYLMFFIHLSLIYSTFMLLSLFL